MTPYVFPGRLFQSLGLSSLYKTDLMSDIKTALGRNSQAFPVKRRAVSTREYLFIKVTNYTCVTYENFSQPTLSYHNYSLLLPPL